ncbi:MAG: hypothetical protein RR336_12120 [Oscillospiraceae bacterium]
MKLGPHGTFLVEFTMTYADDQISRSDFDMDYSGYVIEHFPGFERETPRLAARFARTVDRVCSDCGWMTDDAFVCAICDALDEFFGTPNFSDIV